MYHKLFICVKLLVEVNTMDFYTIMNEYKEAFLSDLKGLIAIPSLEDFSTAKEHAPFGTEVRNALDYMLDLGRKEGFVVKDLDGYAGTIEYGEGKESIGVLGHLDIVPFGEGWTNAPTDMVERDGYILGRGVLDDKGPTMAAFYALKALKDHNIKLDKKIILILGTNEETGMKCMDYYAKHGEIPTCGFTPDADFPVIYGEKGHINPVLVSDKTTVIKKLVAGERPNIVIGKAQATLPKLTDKQKDEFHYYLQVEKLTGQIIDAGEDDIIEIEGKYFHAAMAYNGVNAAVHILNYVGASFHDELAASFANILMDWKGTGLGIAMEGAYMGFLTMNVGIVSIENNHSEITLDIRYPNDTTGKELEQRIIDSLPASITCKPVEDSKPLFVDPNSTIVKTLMHAYQAYTKDLFSPAKTIGGGTYARKFENFVAFGPEFPDRETPNFFVGGPHEKDEGIKVNDLLKAGAIYAQALQDLAKEDSHADA